MRGAGRFTLAGADPTIGTVNESPAPDDDASAGDRTVIRAQPRAPRLERQGWVHQLVVVEGAEPGRRFPLGAEALRVGRKPPSDIVVAEAEVSGRHCEVLVEAGHDSLVVTDLQSTNGTFVDGVRVQGRARLREGGLLQVGRRVLRHDHKPPQEVQASEELDRDLDKAGRYVQSLLPLPLHSGPVLTDWVLVPSARLGGDALGYQALDDHRFATWLIDVAGHGTGAAMHTVSVLNVLRQRALPGVDFARPEQVLARLNAMFQMDQHGGLYFTLWYGVHDRRRRCLDFACAGHHAGYLVDPQRQACKALHTRNLMIGAMPGARFAADQVEVEPGSRLYLFSDGAFDIATRDGRAFGLQDLLGLLLQPDTEGVGEAERLHRAVRGIARPGPFDDDFTVLVTTYEP